MIISINEAKYLGNFKITFTFSDGVNKVIDFFPFLSQAKNPMTRKYLNEEYFKNFQIEFGDIVWNDFELCFPIWDLHEGKI